MADRFSSLGVFCHLSLFELAEQTPAANLSRRPTSAAKLHPASRGHHKKKKHFSNFNGRGHWTVGATGSRIKTVGNG